MGVTALVLAIVTEGLAPGSLDVESPKSIQNPIGVEGFAADIVSGASIVGSVLAVIGFVLGVVSLVLRLRRSRGRERQQLKWFAYVGALALAGLVLAMVDVFAVEVVTGASTPSWVHALGAVGWLTALMLIVSGSRWPSASRSSSTGCTASTWSSTARWSTAC